MEKMLKIYPKGVSDFVEVPRQVLEEWRDVIRKAMLPPTSEIRNVADGIDCCLDESKRETRC